MLIELGHEASVVGVARLYRSFASTLVIDEADRDLASAVESEGVRCVVTDTIMRDPIAAAALGAGDDRGAAVNRLDVFAIDGMPEITTGDDLAAIIADTAASQGTALQDGDVVVVTQKIVSKAEGQIGCRRSRRSPIAQATRRA